MRLPATAAAMIAVVLICPVSTQSNVLDVPSLLDRYASGRFDEAVNSAKNAPDDNARAIRHSLMSAGRLWIDAPGHSRADRMAVAAAFALETEMLRAERGDWAAPTDAFCAGRCVIEWACALLWERNESADTFERDWLAATVALAGGVRDWAFLHAPRSGVELFGDTRGHVDHALLRFPDDARFRLARVQAIAARFEVTIEQDEPREATRLGFPASSGASGPTIIVNGRAFGPGAQAQALSSAAARRAVMRTATLNQLAELANDPVVGAQARTRLAYLQWAGSDYETALAEAQKAAAETTDPDARYLALYIAGLAARSSGMLAKAEMLFASALKARPYSQSASIALAALMFQRGDAAGAYALSEASLANRKDDDDPWRLFQTRRLREVARHDSDSAALDLSDGCKVTRRIFLAFALPGVLLVTTAVNAQRQVFRTTAAQVSVSASVKKGNNIVANLTAKDFTLTDNGVPQTIDAISLEAVPIDVSLFLDTSGSTSGKLDEMKRDTQAIIKMLRPGDRFRLLVIGDSVYEAVPWVDAGVTVSLPFQPVGGISLVQDALLMALLHPIAPDRRHLVVGMTDRRDCGSVVSSKSLRELTSRSEAVIHLVDQSGSGGSARYRVRTCTPTALSDGADIIQEAAERTGGELHNGSFFFRSRSILGAFKKIFDEFRQSYVLRYSPEGVALPGWHAIQVQVPGVKGVTVRARAGYYGS